jgi:hypothetical protein
MKAFFGGCFSLVAGIFTLSLCIQYPVLFWAVISFFAIAVVVGIRNGRKQLQQQKQTPQTNPPLSPDDDLQEDDIRHHYELNGTPFPSTPNQRERSSVSEEEDAEIEAAAATYYERETDHYDEEGER